MSQSLVKNYIHIVFSTKHRESLISSKIENELYSYLGGICNELECQPIKIGGYFVHAVEKDYANKIGRRNKSIFLKMDKNKRK